MCRNNEEEENLNLNDDLQNAAKMVGEKKFQSFIVENCLTLP